jgi:hypothetical protein
MSEKIREIGIAFGLVVGGAVLLIPAALAANRETTIPRKSHPG